MTKKTLPEDWKNPIITYIDENIDLVLGDILEGFRDDPKREEARISTLAILQHPDTEKAYQILTRLYSNEEVRFAKALIVCAYMRGMASDERANHPLDRAILRDNKKLAKSAAEAAVVLRRLIEKATKGCAPFTLYSFSELQRRREGSDTIPCSAELSDQNILYGLQCVADYCSMYMYRRKTRRPNTPLHCVLATLDERFSPPAGSWPKVRSAKSDPTFEAIGLLVRATFKIKRDGAWSMVTTKKTIERLRRKDGHA